MKLRLHIATAAIAMAGALLLSPLAMPEAPRFDPASIACGELPSHTRDKLHFTVIPADDAAGPVLPDHGRELLLPGHRVMYRLGLIMLIGIFMGTASLGIAASIFPRIDDHPRTGHRLWRFRTGK